MNEIVTAESQGADPTTINELLGIVQEMVGDRPPGDAPAAYPDVPFGKFNSTDADGRPIILDAYQIPLQRSRRGEIALINRLRPPGAHDIAQKLEKLYFFFNEGDGVTMEGLDATEPPDFPIPESNDGRRLSLSERALMKIRADQKWREQQLEARRVSGESRVPEDEAQQLLAQLKHSTPRK